MQPLFSVIIPNWNGKHLLKECLNSLAEQTFKNFEIILVDNGSDDGSVEFVRHICPIAVVLELRENIGFAGGVNAGIKVAKGSYFVLLNNDTAVDTSWLEHLASAIGENPNLYIFASKLLSYYNRNIIDSAGDAFVLSSGSYKIGEYKSTENFLERDFIFGACGGGGCYKRELFDKIGYFDEDFFAYFEDVDLSFRANWAGFRCLSVPDAIIYHKVAATSGTNSRIKDRFDIMRRRNYMFLIFKNYPVAFLLQYLPFIFAAHCLKFLLNLCRGRFRVAFMTQWEIVKGLPKMLEKRRKIMAGRSITNAEMKARCVPKYGNWWGFLRHKVATGMVR
jgi:GT2 family glycosyltransferase